MRTRRSVLLPLTPTTEMLLVGLFPMTSEEWGRLLELLYAMKAGLCAGGCTCGTSHYHSTDCGIFEFSVSSPCSEQPEEESK